MIEETEEEVNNNGPEEFDKDKSISLLTKVIGVNIVAALVYMSLEDVVEQPDALPALHGLFAVIAGFFMLFSEKTRSAGVAMILSGLIIFVIGLSMCSFHMH